MQIRDNDDQGPGDILMAIIKTHPLMIASLTLIFALALATVTYLARPTSEANLLIEIDDRALYELTSKAVPDFPYDPPSSKELEVWLRGQAAKTDALAGDERHVIIARGQSLYVTTRGKSSEEALVLADAIADKAMRYLADHRSKVREDMMAWIKRQEVENVREASPPPDDVRLAAHFKAALTEGIRTVQDQVAASRLQVDDISQTVGAEENRAPQNLLVEVGGLMAELDRLREGSIRSDTADVNADSSINLSGTQKDVLLSSQVWTASVPGIRAPVTLSPISLVHHPALQIPVILLIALALSILIAMLYDRYRRDDELAPNSELFGDPYWPGPVR